MVVIAVRIGNGHKRKQKYKKMENVKNQIVTGYPFVSHVDQTKRPTLEASYLKDAFVNFHSQINNLLENGVIKMGGYRYNFKPYLKKYLYKQYGQWNEVFAPNKTTLRAVIYGRIDKIVELKD